LIKVDTREQLPYSFTTSAEIGTLSVGDHSLKGSEDAISIERKSINDLVGCLTHDRDRFERELSKARAMDYFALVIEASLRDILNHRYHSKALPKSIIQSLIAFSVRYRLPVWFAENRYYAQRVTESLLSKFERETRLTEVQRVSCES
jgi:DNA excision repair protein ERCC-4